jgi:hypothetical protein
LTAATAKTTGNAPESAFTGTGKVISGAAPARTSAARGNGQYEAEAIIGASELASGELTAGTA